MAMAISAGWRGALVCVLWSVAPAAAADGKLADWGPLRFGQSADQLRSASGANAQLTPDQFDSEISSLQIPSVRLENVTGTVTARFYNGRAFEFAFFVLNALDGYVPKTQANLAAVAKTRAWCPSVFSHLLDVFAGQYGRPDEIVRPEFMSQLDDTVARPSSARWWFSDGSRLLVVSAQKDKEPTLCTQFIGMRAARYAKTYVPEFSARPK